MENQEQRIQLDQIDALVKDIELSEPVEKHNANVADIVPDNAAENKNVNVQQITLAELSEQFHHIIDISTTVFEFTFPNNMRSLFQYFDTPFYHYYKYASCTFEFKFIFICPPQEAGQVIFSIDNMPSFLSEQLWGNAVDSLEYQSRLPFKMATLGHNPTISMTLEWNSPLQMTDLSQSVNAPFQYDGGVLRGRMFNPRRAVTNVNSGYVQVWGRPTNLKFAGYQPPADPV